MTPDTIPAETKARAEQLTRRAREAADEREAAA
ncbi:MAG: hypothetical protein ACI9HI_002300, partial [Salinirussus sp.]